MRSPNSLTFLKKNPTKNTKQKTKHKSLTQKPCDPKFYETWKKIFKSHLAFLINKNVLPLLILALVLQ